jgi:glycosyltransferase involved in cell wall biosynthesis
MNELSLPVKFGFLGAASERKGFLKYLAVVADISKRFPGLASFHLIGRIRKDQKNLNLPGIESLVEKPETKRLTRDEYIEKLNNLHYVCLFYEKAYEFTASGVLLDCISYNKPIIATPLPIFNKLFQDFGNIGYLCRDIECSEVIEQIIKECNTDKYASQVHNMQKVKNVRTPESLSEKYSELVRLI